MGTNTSITGCTQLCMIIQKSLSFFEGLKSKWGDFAPCFSLPESSLRVHVRTANSGQMASLPTSVWQVFGLVGSEKAVFWSDWATSSWHPASPRWGEWDSVSFPPGQNQQIQAEVAFPRMLKCCCSEWWWEMQRLANKMKAGNTGSACFWESDLVPSREAKSCLISGRFPPL